MADWSGFHRLGHAERLERVARHVGLSGASRQALEAPELPLMLAESFIENAVGSMPVPLGFGVGFVVDGQDVVVPMAIEESSVVAAASHGAKMAAAGGGFRTDVDASVTAAQVELRGVRDPVAARARVEEARPGWMARLDEAIPAMVARGGGVRDIVFRQVADRVVLHILVDCRDAMGANVVNTLAELLAPWAAQAVGGRSGLRIVTNLADTRMARARCTVPVAAVGGMETARAIVEADRLAQLDPYRAATHNKGVLNGVDAVVLATGNDWRAVEAGAHAYAARGGAYRGLTHWRLDGGHLAGSLEMPLPVGTVGGVTRLHPVARACLEVLGSPDARRLAAVAVSVGLAQNLSALRALASAGIQSGHMRLHARNVALQAGLPPEQAAFAAARMAQDGQVSVARALHWARLAGGDGRSGPAGDG